MGPLEVLAEEALSNRKSKWKSGKAQTLMERLKRAETIHHFFTIFLGIHPW
jgi:hypothetical protein